MASPVEQCRTICIDKYSSLSSHTGIIYKLDRQWRIIRWIIAILARYLRLNRKCLNVLDVCVHRGEHESSVRSRGPRKMHLGNDCLRCLEIVFERWPVSWRTIVYCAFFSRSRLMNLDEQLCLTIRLEKASRISNRTFTIRVRIWEVWRCENFKSSAVLLIFHLSVDLRLKRNAYLTYI